MYIKKKGCTECRGCVPGNEDEWPRGKSAADVVMPKGLFISPDIVAVDTAAAKFFNQIRTMPLESVSHLKNAQELKIGTMDLDSIRIKRIKI